VLLHPTSHLVLWEQKSHRHLLEVPALECGDGTKPLAAGDVAQALAGSPSPPCAVILEMPHREIGGECTPWAEVLALRALCDAHGLLLHMDGARLWEALPFYARPENGGLTACQVCAPFDSVYVSFYKGLGGMTGAMLAGTRAAVAEAKVWQRRFGGNLFTLLPYAVSAMDAFDTHKDSFAGRWDAMQAFVDAIKRAAAAAGSSGVLAFTPDAPQCSLVHVHLRGEVAALEAARDRAATASGFKVFRVLRGASSRGEGWTYFEWNVGPVNGAVGAASVEVAWAAFFAELAQV